MLPSSFTYISPSFVYKRAVVIMGVLSWMQTKLHGSHPNRSRRKSEFGADSTRPVDTSSGLPPTEQVNDGWTAAMLSIGTFGMNEGHGLIKSCGRFDELSKLQEELKSHHLQLERLLSCSSSSSSKNRGILRQRSLRKLTRRTLGGFLSRPSFREAAPQTTFNEIIWGLLLNTTHPQSSPFNNPVMRGDQAVQMGWKGEAEVVDDAGKWIRTDSEYIVLEI